DRRATAARPHRQGRKDIARRQLSKEHGDLSGSRVRGVRAAGGRLNRPRDSDVRLPVASVPALPDARYADIRVRDAVAVLDSARSDVPARPPMVPDESTGGPWVLRGP